MVLTVRACRRRGQGRRSRLVGRPWHRGGMLLSAVADASTDVAASSSRLVKTARVAELLAQADPADVGLVVSWLAGELPQRQIGVGWAALRSLPRPADL